MRNTRRIQVTCECTSSTICQTAGGGGDPGQGEHWLRKAYDILENVLTFEYLGSRLQCDGDDQVDVRHRMDIAQAVFGSLSHLWADHSLSRET